MARTPMTTLALSKIDIEEKTTDLRLRLKGRLAVDLADYLRAYGEANGPIDLDVLVPHMLGAFMDADRGFQTWRKGGAGKASAAG
jgi:hypothetical protein